MTSTIRGAKYTVIHPHIAYDTNAAIAVHPDPYGEPSPLQADAEGVRRRDWSQTMSPVSPAVLSPVSSGGSHVHVVRRVSGAVPAELGGMAIAELPGDGPVELPGDEPPQMAGDEPAYITSPGGSPLTPPTDGMPGQIPRVMNRGMVMDEYGTMWYSDTDPEESDGRISDSEVQFNDLSNDLPKAFGKRRPLEYIAESPIEYMAESLLEYPETPDDWPLNRRAARAVQASDSTGTPLPQPAHYLRFPPPHPPTLNTALYSPQPQSTRNTATPNSQPGAQVALRLASRPASQQAWDPASTGLYLPLPAWQWAATQARRLVKRTSRRGSVSTIESADPLLLSSARRRL
jgi:hypothetical protein